jgi:hypothetical protein
MSSKFTLAHKSSCLSVSFNPFDDTILASGCNDGILYLWNLVS